MAQQQNTIPLNQLSPWLKRIRYAGIASFLALFIFIVSVGINGKQEMEKLLHNGIATQATITALNINTIAGATEPNNKQYIIVYSYQDNSGITHSSSRYSNKTYFEQQEVGQQWPMHYLASAPNKHELDSVLQNRLALPLSSIMLRGASVGLFAFLLFEFIRLLTAMLIKKQQRKTKQNRALN